MINLKLACRTLFRTPFVTIVAIASLALGIGANAAIFSLFNQMLLRPLPVPEPARLVNLGSPGPKPGLALVRQRGRLRRRLQLSRCSATSSGRRRVFTGSPRTSCSAPTCRSTDRRSAARAMLVSGSYFPVLGVQPALGRLLGPAGRPDRRASRTSSS